MKTLGVVGLGLIGNSFVKAYVQSDQWQILAYDINESINQFAIITEDVSEKLSRDNIGSCDLIVLAVYPKAAIDYLREMGPYISKDTVVIDCCGVKECVCDECFAIARQHGFTYAGGHPMAGRHYSGYKYSTEKLYRGAPMVIVPEKYDDIALLNRIKSLLEPAGFGSISVTTAEEHDKLVAFTSQLAHIVSNAYVKSPTAERHKGFSAGSYKDMTRVAWLNEDMWTELFMYNRENLIKEMDRIISSLQEYREALADADSEKMKTLLAAGKKRKSEIDG